MVIMPATVPLESVMLMLMLMLMLHIITLLLLPTTHPEATTVMLAATTTLESVMLMLMLMLMLLIVMLLPTHTASTVMLAATMVIMPATVPLESVMLMLMLLLLPTLLDMDIDRMATITRDKSEVRCCSYSSHASPAIICFMTTVMLNMNKESI